MLRPLPRTLSRPLPRPLPHSRRSVMTSHSTQTLFFTSLTKCFSRLMFVLRLRWFRVLYADEHLSASRREINFFFKQKEVKDYTIRTLGNDLTMLVCVLFWLNAYCVKVFASRLSISDGARAQTCWVRHSKACLDRTGLQIQITFWIIYRPA